ncbi:plasmid pRiA4b ORF-3 family protein [Treponema parvum]|uniref:plasmid pRiA4b ORF-3 family protein n=1 Tax=Treponema parvum TaxID=138851 RepID=UPI001AEBE60E|nr:plasmid pRiA4b ORF-3 family protein [Treponema parvum]QTQ15317.1 plasmid pRiA4b ORF-3 family protein [Treponema parvum]
MIFRLTKKALDYINAYYEDEIAPQNKYSDWFVDIIDSFDEKKYFLLTNAYSLFSVVIPAKDLNSKEDFILSATEKIKEYFNANGMAELFLNNIKPFLAENSIRKTNSRAVQGSMRGMKSSIPFMLRFQANLQEDLSLKQLNDILNKRSYKNLLTYEDEEMVIPKNMILSAAMIQPVQNSTVIRQKKLKEKPVYKIKALLCGFEKEIWREFIINPNTTMENLAFALMIMFNMDGSHLYEFEIRRRDRKEKELRKKGFSKESIKNMLKFISDIEIKSYIDEEMDRADANFMLETLGLQAPECFEAYAVKIIRFLNKENPEIHFLYDFGDGWDIKLELKKSDFLTDIPASSLPFVTDGKGSGIIEDCGGIGGLEAIKEAFRVKSGKNYKQYKEWLGVDDMDLSTFDAEKVNKNISKQIKAFKKDF